MVLVYLALVIVLAVLAWLTGVRAGGLDNKHAKINGLLLIKQAGIDKNNPFASIALAVDAMNLEKQRQKLESGYIRWSDWHGWLTKRRDALWAWRGKTAPYIVGIADAAGVFAILEVCGLADQVRWATVLQLVHGYAANFLRI